MLKKIMVIRVQNAISKGNIDYALKMLDKMSPDDHMTCYYRGICYFENLDFPNAAENIEIANQLNPSEDYAGVLAQVLILQKEFDRARDVLFPFKNTERLKKVFKAINSENRVRYYEYLHDSVMGMKALKQENYQDSVEHYLRSLKYIDRKDEMAKVHHQIAAIYMNYLDDSEEASNHFSKACQLNPGKKRYKRHLLRAQAKSKQ